MHPVIDRLERDREAELVLGIVAPVGADLDGFESLLADQLRRYRYAPQMIRLSRLISKARGISVKLLSDSYYEYLDTYMRAGNELRERTQEILALWAIAEVRAARETNDGPRSKAWIIRSLKHPDEVHALRTVYGAGFFLIGLAGPEERRVRYLVDRKGLTESQATDVIERDKGEANGYGQHTRDAFELSDVFIELTPERREAQLDRFLKLVFGKVVETPTADEHAMFLAYASATRSADLSRQVGAAVWKEGIGVVATGCNDVPRAGGGLYETGPDDCRDQVERAGVRGHDANQRQRDEIVADIAAKVAAAVATKNHPVDVAVIAAVCLKTRLRDITEFGRAVHAEMDALLTCARAGVSTRGATLFSTTFPCHNCAKHILAAGIRRVVYVEPYEKSLAVRLHGDAIVVGGGDRASTHADHAERVRFEAFVGVGPRRFLDLFSMRVGDGYPLKRKDKLSGEISPWSRDRAEVRVPLPRTSYLEREALVAELLPSLLEEQTS